MYTSSNYSLLALYIITCFSNFTCTMPLLCSNQQTWFVKEASEETTIWESKTPNRCGPHWMNRVCVWLSIGNVPMQNELKSKVYAPFANLILSQPYFCNGKPNMPIISHPDSEAIKLYSCQQHWEVKPQFKLKGPESIN